MTTEKQIAANRENAKKSTGPRTLDGKRKSRRNALRHGLTAETVIAVLEETTAYEALAKAINADFRPATNFELQLVGRLISLLWRLRRATAIESGLLALQAESLRQKNASSSKSLDLFHRLLDPLQSQRYCDSRRTEDAQTLVPNQAGGSIEVNPLKRGLARSFLKLTIEDSAAFDRLSRYEMGLWRQTVETVLLLNAINRDGNTNGGDFNSRYLRMRGSRRTFRRSLWPPFTAS